MRRWLFGLGLLAVGGCGEDAKVFIDAAPIDAHPDGALAIDAAPPDASVDAAAIDAPAIDAPPIDASTDAPPIDASTDAPPIDATIDAPAIDAPAIDAPAIDATIDAASITYNCGAFVTAPTWILSPGFHAVVIADATDGLNQPVALTVAGAAFGGRIYVVNQGDNRVLAIDPATGTTTAFVAGAAWPVAPTLLTAIVHDDTDAFDGNLYVADQGSNSDGDSRVYRITAAGVAAVLASPPGPALDDVFGLAFSPGGAYPAGLYVTGDTDGALPDWAVYATTGVGVAFSEVAGAETIVVDRAGTYGGGLWAARPAGGGYAGDDSIGRIAADGTASPRLAAGLPGVHGLAFAPPGPFGGRVHAASWSSGRLFSVSTAGAIADLATGLQLTNFDANILGFSPDGRVLYVADRTANRVVCIEPTPAQ